MTGLDFDLSPMDLRWTGRRLQISASPDSRGAACFWTPQHVLVAGLANRLMAAFLALAGRSRLPVFFHCMRAGARLEKSSDQDHRFSRISLQPEICVAAMDLERARKVLNEAEKSCFYGQPLQAVVRVEPQFVTHRAEVGRAA